MAYVRKTKDEWIIEGNYGYGWEEESVYNNRKEAEKDLKIYNLESGGMHRLVKKESKIKCLI